MVHNCVHSKKFHLNYNFIEKEKLTLVKVYTSYFYHDAYGKCSIPALATGRLTCDAKARLARSKNHFPLSLLHDDGYSSHFQINAC